MTHPNDEMRLVRADETVIATADYKAMMNEAAMVQVARAEEAKDLGSS